MTSLTKHNARRQPGEVGKADIRPAAAVSFPEVSTVKARVLADLLEGRGITHLDTWREHGSSRLAHHVYVLRRLGWTIQTDDITVSTSDANREATIARYRLPLELIKQAGTQARDFVNSVRGSL